jgi:hypothetical protein
MSVNLAVVRGTCSSPCEVRVLESGTAYATLQITARVEGEVAISVPVVVWDPAPAVEALDVGDEVVVLGRVRRRFYKAGAATASRTEIEAQTVVPASARKRVESLVRRAIAAIEDLTE